MAFVGDDIIDLPAMRTGGPAIAVSNARSEVKREAHYVTPRGGGEGARDAVELPEGAGQVEKNLGKLPRGEKSESKLSAVSYQPSAKP